MDQLRRLELHSFVSVVEVEKCLGNDHLNNVLQSIVKNNGEGIVVSKPNSLYVGERMRVRLKVKVLTIATHQQVHEEVDVRVLAVVPNGLYCAQYVSREFLQAQIKWKKDNRWWIQEHDRWSSYFGINNHCQNTMDSSQMEQWEMHSIGEKDQTFDGIRCQILNQIICW